MIFYWELGWRFLVAALIGLTPAVLLFLPLFNRRKRRRCRGNSVSKSMHRLVALAALSIVGATAGVAGGLSREPAVAAIIPAFLALLGGVSTYLFSANVRQGTFASLCSVALAVSLLAGFGLGAVNRNFSLEHREVRAICAEAYTDAELLSDEAAFALFIEKLGPYCEKSMNWRAPKQTTTH